MTVQGQTTGFCAATEPNRTALPSDRNSQAPGYIMLCGNRGGEADARGQRFGDPAGSGYAPQAYH
jgi:hypothetical protein